MAGNEDIFKKMMKTGHSAAWDQQWDKAASAYRTALEEVPDHPLALANLGLALFESRQYEEAIQVYKKATQVSQTDPVPFEKVATLSARLGQIQEAILYHMKAAELYIKAQDAQKAIQNWANVIQLDTENISAHKYLAMVHERLGHQQQAISEFLATASLFQHSGNASKAAEMIGRALHLDPESLDARQAQSMLRNGQPLPKPLRPQGGTAPLAMAQVKQLETPVSIETSLDPIAETLQKALTRLAEILFELSEESAEIPAARRTSMQTIVRGTGALDTRRAERTQVMLHISQAIDYLTRENDSKALEELEMAIQSGLKSSAAYYILAYLQIKAGNLDIGLQNLKIPVKHEVYALGTHLLAGQTLYQMKQLPGALLEYLEAIKAADVSLVPPEQAAGLRSLYEPIIETQKQLNDPSEQEQLYNNLHELLMQPNWRSRLIQARSQLPKPEEGMPPVPLAEMITQTRSSLVIDYIGKVHSLAKAGLLRTAMDEAFEALKEAPSYLPLHTLIGDLLTREGRTQDAITKYNVVARGYSSRGEISQAVDILRRIIQVAPMDLAARNNLIEQLSSRGSISEAIVEYINLAEIHYRLADLDMARKTYTSALHLAQKGPDSQSWSIKLLHRMADIDMQRLDWRQALRVYEQIRSLQPDDIQLRKNLVILNLRLGEIQQVSKELSNYLTYLQNSGRREEAIPYLEDLIKEEPKHTLLRRALAEEYRLVGRIPDAITQLDIAGEFLRDAGDREGAIQAVEAIIAMNPRNVADYTSLLTKLKSG